MTTCNPAQVPVPTDDVPAALLDALLRLGYRGDPGDGAEQLVVSVLPAGCGLVAPLVLVLAGVAFLLAGVLVGLAIADVVRGFALRRRSQ
ncbi:hypothetical protein ACL02T_12620 [Pseudonocardia sp. RS010]|uniref:hypothetical protein n=1 Tax=Pseudonocardia sp. RS010 TaxID=3385979 RepID=UPI0039A37559